RGLAHEPARLAEHGQPPEPHLLRQGRARELVPVERHAGLEAQRVAGSEAARHESRTGAGLRERLPERRGGIRIEVELETVLARVARARHEHLVAAEVARDGALVAQSVELWDVEALDAPQDLLGARRLQGDEGDVVGLVVDDAVETGGPL